MRVHLARAWVVVALSGAFAASARGADNLSEIMKKTDLSSEDRARVDQEIQERARRLVDIEGDAPVERAEARARLVETAGLQGASEPALSYYADRCGHHLAPLILGGKRTAAEDAAMVLRAVGRKETAPAVVAGLRSTFESVQYQCAVAVKQLHAAIAGERALVSDALTSLGDIGAKTSNPVLLRVVYEAINFAGSNPQFPAADLQGQALAKVFEARRERLKFGSRDEYKDAAGYQAAADAATAGAGLAVKKSLVEHLVGFLRVHAERYGDRSTHKEYVPTIRRMVELNERAIAGILQTENTTPPGPSLSSVVNNPPSGATARQAMEAVAGLRSVLKRDPWNIQ